jgi:hypothetical protein
LAKKLEEEKESEESDYESPPSRCSTPPGELVQRLMA